MAAPPTARQARLALGQSRNNVPHRVRDGLCSRRRDFCHSADTASSSMLKTPTKERGVCSRMTASPMANDLVVQRAGLPTDRPADLGEGGVKERQHEGSGRARKGSGRSRRGSGRSRKGSDRPRKGSGRSRKGQGQGKAVYMQWKVKERQYEGIGMSRKGSMKAVAGQGNAV